VCRIKPDKDGYVVPSQQGKGKYRVTLKPYPKCSCPDYFYCNRFNDDSTV